MELQDALEKNRAEYDRLQQKYPAQVRGDARARRTRAANGVRHAGNWYWLGAVALETVLSESLLCIHG